MDPRTQERVEQWDSRPFSGGYDGLADLADGNFSGAVTASGTWLFLLNGRVVGVVNGSIEDFENASGTSYNAPAPSLPLLCTMEEHGGETRANYYTNETPLTEVDSTLQSGSFTGYIELSENVLSGDYYAVYYGGRRMAAAYIGNAERLLTGDEAFERAADEVGIYEVTDVEIDVTDVPGTESAPAESETDASSAEDGPAESPTAVESETASSEPADTVTESAPEPSTDPTESAIESIALSGSDPDSRTSDDSATPIEDITIDDTDPISSTPTETAEPSGITAADESEPEPAADGITDAGQSTPADSRPTDRADAEPAEAAAEADPTEATPTEVTLDAEPIDSEPVEQDTASTDSDLESADPDTLESDTAAETEDDGGTGPDLAEVEAAAEQLDQNDISWTEDDVASTADADEAAADPAPKTAQSPSKPDESTPDDEESGERFEQEAEWRETRSIPSIDPDNSESPEPDRDSPSERTTTQSSSRKRSSSASSQADGTARVSATTADDSSERTQQRSDQQRSSQQRAGQQRSSQQRSSRQETGQQDANRQQRRKTNRAESGSSAGSSDSESQPRTTSETQDERVATLEQRIETLDTQRSKLKQMATELQTERDELRSENEELSSTVDRLQSRIEELEGELEQARQMAADTDDAESETLNASTQLSPQQALDRTNLFVRYGSKSQPTLDSAHDGEADRSEVASNLRLEHHTSFDATDTAVDGEPYEAFLTGTMEYRFVDWLTEMVLYEIRDTGNADGLGDLYDAIPRIDRAELDATISLADDDTEDVPDQVSFDVVAFDKMGNPLVVANLNDSREPATQGMLEELEAAASAVKANYPDLAAATVVTSSYFEPGALEVTEEATSGGLLSRGSKLSYVNLSRKQGYHLCLVESRSEGFHMNVPEL